MATEKKGSKTPDKANAPVERTRYSDADLKEFKELIMEKLETARKELHYLQDQIRRTGDHGTDDTENKFVTLDDSAESVERENINNLASRQIQFIDNLERALIRIENKSYGVCRVTGKLIEKARLKAVPHATLSMEAKLIQKDKPVNPTNFERL